MDTNNKRIIIFDDDEDILSICTYIYPGRTGLEVPTFTDDNNLAERVLAFQAAIIFMDNWIPDYGGIVATQILKKSADLKNIPVVYFSAISDIQLLMEAAGADTFLSKPFDIADLERVIEKVYQTE